jgi:predicted kinase
MKNKPVITMISGLSGSGKTTMALKSGNMRFNLDDIRRNLGMQNSWSKNLEAVAVEMLLSGIEAAVDAGQDVITDNTFLYARIPNMLRKRIGGRATFSTFRMDTDIEECIRRDALRPESVGEAVIRKQAKSKWRLSNEYMNVWPQVVPYVYQEDLPWCFIVDMDGTFAIKAPGRDIYDASRCDEDTPDPAVQAIVNALNRFEMSDDSTVFPFFLSGRDSAVWENNWEWIRQNSYVTFPVQAMRAEGDTRPDFVIKYELFDKYIRGKYNVLFALDDRDSIVRLWREMGIRTLQVNYGNF